MPSRDDAIPPLLDSGRLALSDGASLYWETSGRAEGVPVLWLHGGPGSGLRGERYRRKFDADRNLIIGVDQRGCGRSLPLVTDDLSSLVGNTTERLITDLEELRVSLGLERWIVTGGSWGSTLALAYAVEHPERVIGVVVAAVTTTSRDEVDWITEGVGRIFPEAWAAFEAASARREGERVVEAYARRLADPADPADRARAADDWDAWESTHVSLDPAWRPGPTRDDLVERAVFGTLVTHYWANDGFLSGDRAILARTDQLADVPVVLLHGRRDISGPVVTPWRLHQRLPHSELHVVEEEGHGGPRQTELMREAVARLTEETPGT
ncbi:alpha/beta fold hydrolase [Curtobacterium sp. ISL-83]|uniref:alpha/beta fold hydrolase n=1 Tax=Curtobacterium sp. ISL-83 TaxID=2819145 RepID=UPI001BE54BF0|nr:alpha/beta fold hydrolase [Curtobacterium sp. ISL-83]MBT2504106.1 alpha/beta fold hydrolase [Curtobacterium sp. ISL-83]